MNTIVDCVSRSGQISQRFNLVSDVHDRGFVSVRQWLRSGGLEPVSETVPFGVLANLPFIAKEPRSLSGGNLPVGR